MFDEAAFVAFLPGGNLMADFQRRQGTNAAGNVDKSSPQHCGDVKECDPSLFQNQQSTKYREQNEQQVKNYNQICQQLVDHAASTEQILKH